MNFIKYFYKFLANGIGFNSMVVMIESKMILKEALAILDHPLISERYFFPFRTVFDRPYMIPVKEATLGSYLYRAKSGRDARTVVLFHGNGEVVSDYFDTYLPIFVDLGLNCLVVEYRGYGMSTGNPKLGQMMTDVASVLADLSLPPEKIILFGRSLGSIFALEAIRLFPDICALIIESGIADMDERIRMRVRAEEMGISAEQLDLAINTVFDHQSKLSGFKGDTLILHARNDFLVPHRHADLLFQWANSPKYIKSFEKGDHNSIFFENRDEYIAAIRDYIRSLKMIK